MKKIYFLAAASLIVVSLFFSTSNPALAAKKKSGQTSQSLKAVSNKGEAVLYGSILSPKEDEANILLSKQLLSKLRKVGLGNLSINLVSSLDSTKTYTVPSDAINIQRKAINKKAGKYLVISLFNLSTPSGITISPSSLPTDDYKLRITGKEIDATTETIEYLTPALIVGTVDSNSTGLVTIESLLGEKISDRTVATNPNGTFFTEVRANKIGPKTKARKVKQVLKAQTLEGETPTEESDTKEIVEEELNTCVVHAVTEKDLKAIAPLDSDPENNSAITNEPLEVNDSTTLTANLAIESAKEGDDELALEAAKNIVKDLKDDDQEEEEFFHEGEDFECDIGDIGQFSSRCSGGEEDIVSIGRDFREFVSKANCNFPEFKLIKAILPKLPEDANEFIGRGYCEISQEEDNDRPCEIYKEILRDFKDGLISQLPCPPDFCDEFSNIKPPKCYEPHRICDESDHPEPRPFRCIGPRCEDFHDDPCIHRPQKDYYCARIGIDIKAEECKSDSLDRYGPKWVIESDDEGNQYCVPSNIPKPVYSSEFDGFRPPSTPKEIANECKVNSCHKSCGEKYGHFGPGPIPPPIFTAAPPPVLDSGLKAQFAPPPFTEKEPIYTSESPIGNYDPPQQYICEECDCHRTCDAEAGRLIECNDRDKYFSKKCCEKGPGPIFFAQTYSAQSFQGGFGPGRGPVRVNVYDCLCGDLENNFNEKGYVKPEAQEVCLESCPPGYEKGLNNDQCLPICDTSKGFVRDPGGICRKKCPEGSFDDGSGYCRCPEGQSIGKSGRCEPNSCPEYCRPYVARLLEYHDSGSFGGSAGYVPPTTGPGYIPPTIGPGYIPPGYGGSSLPAGCERCIGGGGGTCPPGQILIEENVVCVTAPCPPSFKRCACPDRSNPINGQCGQTTTCPGNMYPNPNPGPNKVSCICLPGLPYWDSRTNSCVASCPNGPPPGQTFNYPEGSPIPCDSGSQNTCPPPYIANPSGNPPCKCPDATPIQHNGNCVVSCPAGLIVDYPQYSTQGMRSCLCPDKTYPSASGTCTSSTCLPASPYRCPDGRCVVYASECGSGNYCSPGITVGTNGCTCNNAGGGYQEGSYCRCPSGSSSAYSKEYGCSGGTGRPCTVGEGPSNGCYCFGAGFNGSDGKCQCSGGVQYTGGGCSTSSTTNYCAAGTGPSSTSNCTCAPGATIVNGICQCPNNNTPAYTPPAGCGSTTTTCPSGSYQCPSGLCVADASRCPANCTAPFVNDAAFQNQCVCPSSTPYRSGSTCVATCPSPQVASTIPGGPNTSTEQVCRCPDGTLPTGTGTTGICPVQCPTGTTADSAAPGGCRCPESTREFVNNTCQCRSGLVSDPQHPDGTCKCPTGSELNPSTNTCPTGSITLTSVTISGSNLVINVTKNLPVSTCIYLYKDGSLNTSLYSICSDGTVTIPTSSISPALVAGNQVKFCNPPNTICSGYVAVTSQ